MKFDEQAVVQERVAALGGDHLLHKPHGQHVAPRDVLPAEVLPHPVRALPDLVMLACQIVQKTVF